MAMTCPACGRKGALLTKCSHCGDTRCMQSSICPGTMGGGKGGGGVKMTCSACKKGKRVRL
jgi:hypothetical protein